jgi:hypothetical protein
MPLALTTKCVMLPGSNAMLPADIIEGIMRDYRTPRFFSICCDLALRPNISLLPSA